MPEQRLPPRKWVDSVTEIDRAELLKTVNRMPGYISAYLIDGESLKTLYYSRNIPAVLDYQEEEYKAQTRVNALDTIFKGDRAEVRKCIAQCIEADGEDVYCDFCIPCKERGYIKTLCISRIVGTIDGKPVMISCFTNFARQEVPTALPGLTDSDCKRLVDNIPAGIAVMRMRAGKLELVAANPALSTIVGVTERKIAGPTQEDFYRRVHPDDLPIAKAAIQSIFSERHGASCVYRALNEKTRKYVWLHAVAKSYDLPDGSQIAYINYTDVTAQKETETELRESRQRYQLAVRGANLTVWEYDIQNRCISCPDDGFNRAGFESVIADMPDALLDYVDEKYRAQYLLMFADINAGKRDGSCELWYRRSAHDKPRCTHMAYSTVFDSRGNPVKAYGIMQDITLQKLEAEKYNGLMQKMLRTSSSAIFTACFDLTMNRCEKNKGITSNIPAIEYPTADDFFATAVTHIVEEKAAAAFRAEINRRALLTSYFAGRPEVSQIYQRRMENGRSQWVETHVTMAQNPNTGNIEAIYCVFDRSEKMRGERLIQRLTNEEYDFIGIIDVEQRLFSIMNIKAGEPYALERLSNITEAEIVNLTVSATVAPEDRERYIHSIALDNVILRLCTEKNYTVSFTYLTPSGKRRRKQLRFCWLDDTHEEILVVRTDITAAYLHDREQMRLLQSALRSTEKANALRLECIANLGHDLRTPLNAIVGYSRLARVAKDGVLIQDHLEKIEKSANQLQSIISNMLDFSRLESGETEFLPESIETAKLFEDVADAIRDAASAKNVRVEMNDSRWRMPSIYADRASLFRILTSLLLNSIRFSAPGGRVSFSAESFSPVGDGANCRFRIIDHGSGISKEFLPYLFEPFAQEERSTDPESANVSLGLAVVKRLVEMMNGSIWAESEKGKGTTFTVLFRFSEPQKAAEPAAEDAPGSLAGKRILICEDNPLNLEITQTLLEQQGALVTCADNGEMGLKVFAASQENEYDAVLMDIRMPRMDGLTAASRIRSLNRSDAQRVPIIALTADGLDRNMDGTRSSGVNAYLEKPFSPKDLFDILADRIAHSH
ncbi:MAG: ATP-binding protein [Oscillospiraceae bacterium]|jgi:signal transduction histidine kinase/PAS domain-containing protein/BarA-like signal transduction histidine kinase